MAEVWDEADVSAAVREARLGRIVAPGVRLTGEQLARVIGSLSPRGAQLVDLTDAVVSGDCDFGGVSFSGTARFSGATFDGAASFQRARFAQRPQFERVSFRGGASFEDVAFPESGAEGATFAGAAFDVGTSFIHARCGGFMDFDHAHFGGEADFRGAELSGAGFGLATFAGAAVFVAASFERAFFGRTAFRGQARFAGAAFSEVADFNGARFDGFAHFSEARFGGPVRFEDGARFAGPAAFDAVTFAPDAQFAGVHVDGDLSFAGARFEGHVRVTDAVIGGDAVFADARLDGSVDVTGTTVARRLSFDRTRFDSARGIGPVLAAEALTLSGAIFEEHVRIEASAPVVSCDHAIFRSGVDLFARWAEISAEAADFAGPSLFAALPGSGPSGDEPPFLGHERPASEGGWERLDHAPDDFEPRVVSLRGAKVARLTLSRVDLTACRFASAHGLDELRFERVRFAEPPGGWTRREGTLPWPRRVRPPRRIRLVRPIRWSRRRTIAEEQRWRYLHSHGDGWYAEPVHGPEWLHQGSELLEPPQIARIYRALRRGREAERDEPGAADFYYGEMEMRRQRGRTVRWAPRALDRPTPRGERLTIALYWLVSGYGLRASRALAALALTILLLAVPLDLWGFRPDRGYGRALLYAAESSISLLRAPEAKLTAGGEVVQIALRLAGPLFFGLAVLALRSRVKR